MGHVFLFVYIYFSIIVLEQDDNNSVSSYIGRISLPGLELQVAQFLKASLSLLLRPREWQRVSYYLTSCNTHGM